MELLIYILELPITQIFIGGSITLIVAHIYYRRAGDQLRTEAEALAKTNRVLSRLIENQNHDLDVIRDEAGNPIAIRYNLEFADAITPKASISGINLSGSSDDKE